MNIRVAIINEKDQALRFVAFFTNSISTLDINENDSVFNLPRLNRLKKFPHIVYGINISFIGQIEISVWNWDNVRPVGSLIGLITVYFYADPEPDSPKSVSDALDIILNGHRNNKV